MITEIEIENFKSLEKVRLKLGKLNLFVGTNASGKSNFFDALRVLQGIGFGFTIDEILNGKPQGASPGWEGIRGGSVRARFASAQDRLSPEHISFRVGLKPDLSYSVKLDPVNGTVDSEALRKDSQVIFFKEGDWIFDGSSRSRVPYFEDQTPVIGLRDFWHRWGGDQISALESCRSALSNVQRLSPALSVLRSYGQGGRVKRMGDAGENFASIAKIILEDPKTKEAYLSWLQELAPLELEELVILKGVDGEPFFALKEGLRTSPATVLSDGTLRFAAIVAAFFQPDMPDILTLEEIENGIHPNRIRLLVELLKSQSREEGPQVFATTHSPVVLAWLREEDYETTFICKRDDETGASIIKPLSEIPRLIDIVKGHSLGDLFMEGWMEMAL